MSYAQLPVRGYRKWDDMGELYTRIIFPFCFDTRRQYNVKARPVYLKHRFIAWWDYNCKSATSNLQGWYAIYPLHIPADEHFADGCIAYHMPSAVVPDTSIIHISVGGESEWFQNNFSYMKALHRQRLSLVCRAIWTNVCRAIWWYRNFI